MQKYIAAQFLITTWPRMTSLLEEIRKRPTENRKETFPKHFEKCTFFSPYQNKLYSAVIDLLSQQRPLGLVDILTFSR